MPSNDRTAQATSVIELVTVVSTWAELTRDNFPRHTDNTARQMDDSEHVCLRTCEQKRPDALRFAAALFPNGYGSYIDHSSCSDTSVEVFIFFVAP